MSISSPPAPSMAPDADLDEALKAAKQCGFHVMAVSSTARGLLRTAPSLTREAKARDIERLKQYMIEATTLWLASMAVIAPVKTELSDAMPGTASHRGTHAPNAHEALVRLVSSVAAVMNPMWEVHTAADITEANCQQVCQHILAHVGTDSDGIWQLRAWAEKESDRARLRRQEKRALLAKVTAEPQSDPPPPPPPDPAAQALEEPAADTPPKRPATPDRDDQPPEAGASAESAEPLSPLNAECESALHHYGKRKGHSAHLTPTEKSYLVCRFWRDTQGLTPAKVRKKFVEVVDRSEYYVSNDSAGTKRAKQGIYRGKTLLGKIPER